MKCQKCGADLKTEALYCNFCGTEYQIVPDFELELEISMAETLSGLGESIQEENRIQKNDPEEKKNKQNRGKRFFSMKKMVLIFTLLFFFCFSFVSYRNSVAYIEKTADQAADEGQYLEAAILYGRLKDKEPATAKWYLQEGRMKLLAGNTEEAGLLGIQALEMGEEKKEAYCFLLDLYRTEDNYQAMHELLIECSDKEVLEEYGEYMAGQPLSNYSSGQYNTSIEIVLRPPVSSGEIYYTLDGSQPGIGSSLYQEPIVLGNGNHRLKALFINSYGISGQVLEMSFLVNAEVPLPPWVEPESGMYESATYITPSREEGTEIYYTNDGTVPTKESKLYESPIPMPLGESSFSFVAYSYEGIPSEVTTREYLLNIKTGITQEEAGNLLVQTMIEKGLILDKNGALKDRYGVHCYFYSYPIKVGEKHYYVFAEHYLENEINQRTGKYYAVEVMQGECYRLIQTEEGINQLGEI